MTKGNTTLFDEYADRYAETVNESIRFSGAKVDFFLEGKARHLVRVADQYLGNAARVKALDVGCGIGTMHPFLVDRFCRLSGIDVAEQAIAQAESANAGVDYRTYAGKQLPYDDGSFDLTFTVCVLHHVAPADWRGFAREMFRVTSPGGVATVFEHNPLNPLTRVVVNRCEFDKDAILLTASKGARLFMQAGFVDITRRYIFFTPLRGRLFAQLDLSLGWLPLGAQYYITGRRPTGDTCRPRRN